MRTLKLFQNRSTFFCFSPAVMVATFLIEISLAIYTLIRYKMTPLARIGALTLVLLAIFQIAEYNICSDVHSFIWSRIGFVAITLLPFTGLYLVSRIAKKTHFLRFGLISAIGFVLYFLLVPKSISDPFCAGNYVIFHGSQAFYICYSIYYFGFLILGIWEAYEGSSQTKAMRTKRSLWWLIIGYLSFMVPMTLAFIFIPVTRVAIASIMCGFALILAFIIAFKIVPLGSSKKT